MRDSGRRTRVLPKQQQEESNWYASVSSARRKSLNIMQFYVNPYSSMGIRVTLAHFLRTSKLHAPSRSGVCHPLVFQSRTLTEAPHQLIHALTSLSSPTALPATYIRMLTEFTSVPTPTHPSNLTMRRQRPIAGTHLWKLARITSPLSLIH